MIELLQFYTGTFPLLIYMAGYYIDNRIIWHILEFLPAKLPNALLKENESSKEKMTTRREWVISKLG